MQRGGRGYRPGRRRRRYPEGARESASKIINIVIRMPQRCRPTQQLDNLPSTEDRRQTDRVATPARAGLRRCCWRHAARLATLARS